MTYFLIQTLLIGSAMPKRHKQTRKTTKQRHNQSRKQRGGLGNSLKFQYTKRDERGIWIDTLYPYANTLLNAVKQIPWGSYAYEGPAEGIIDGGREEFEEIGIPIPENQQNKRDVNFTMTAPIRITGPNPVPYRIFGGVACEIWNKAYPQAANLHETTDPTADIDIVVNAPCFESTHPILKDWIQSIQLMKEDDTYTPFADHYTRWIFERVVDLVRSIVHLFPKSLHTPNKEDTAETSRADLVTTVGPFLIARLIANNSAKIQVTTKVEIPSVRRNDPKRFFADHCMEFLIEIKNPMRSCEHDTYTTTVDGLFVDRIPKLIESQKQGLEGRLETIKEVENAIRRGNTNVPELSHKLINHYGRLLYLGKLFKYMQIKKLIPILYEPEIRKFMSYATLFEPTEGRVACPPPKGCSPEAYARPFEELLEYRNAEKTRENAIWKERIAAARRRAPARNLEGEESESNIPPVTPKLTPGARFLQMMGFKKGNSK